MNALRASLRASLLLCVLGRALGFGAGDGTREMCDAINLARSFGVSLDQAMASYVDSANLPAGCSLDEAFDQMCSSAGLACASAFAVPSPINFGSATVNATEDYTRRVNEYASCWDDRGALRPISNCVSASDFDAMIGAMSTANASIASAITTKESALASAPAADRPEIEAELDALQKAQEAVLFAHEAATESSVYVKPSDDSGGLSPGAIAGIAVGAVAFVAAVGAAAVLL